MSTQVKSHTTSTPHHNKPPPVFTAADFQKWNETTSVVQLPAKLVGKAKIPQLRGELVKAIGEKKVAAVQALSPTKYRVEFRSSSYRHSTDINGISFRGVTLTPHPAYEEVKSVFVDRAPLQMPDQYLFDILAPYGRVLSVAHLKVKGFQNVKSGTRRVSMVIQTSIPAVIKISNIQLSFRYRGQPSFCFVCQEVGHTPKDCPRSRKARDNKYARNADLGSDDLRHKLRNVKEGDLRVKLLNAKKASQMPPAGGSATPSTSSPPSEQVITNSKKVSATPSSSQPDLNNTELASSPSLPVRDTVTVLKEIFKHTPIKTDGIAESAPTPDFDSLAVAAKGAASGLATGVETISSGFGLKLNGKPVLPAAKQPSAPGKDHFEFRLNPARFSSSLQGLFPWTATNVANNAFSGAHSRKSDDKDEDDDYDITLRERAQKRRRERAEQHLNKKLCKCAEKTVVLPPSLKMEEDSVEECLLGDTVIDPLGPEHPDSNAAPETDLIDPAPEQLTPAAMSSPVPDDRDAAPSVLGASTPASLLSSGPIEVLSPVSSDELFNTLVASAPAVIVADSLESDLRLESETADVQSFSDPAGQDRVRELMLDLPVLYLE